MGHRRSQFGATTGGALVVAFIVASACAIPASGPMLRAPSGGPAGGARRVPTIARIAGVCVGWSTVGDLTRRLGSSYRVFTGGHPRGGRGWRLPGAAAAVECDGFDYSDRGRVVDTVTIAAACGARGRARQRARYARLYGWLGAVFPGQTARQVRERTARLPAPRRARSEWTWTSRGYSRVSGGTAFRFWAATVHFKRGHVDWLRVRVVG
jgi:hypothetical protein